MKDGKKLRGTKARVRAYKKRLQCISTVMTVAILITIVAVSGFLIFSQINSSPNQTFNPDQTSNQPSQLKAALVDHLSLTAPNRTFTQTATNTLQQAGYAVDYYPGEEVMVEFYRNLPTHGYDLIILRVHSSARGREGQEVAVSLFTSERATTTKYVYEQLTDKLVKAAFSRREEEKGIIYFAVSPLFVTQSMRNRFQNTTIIMMGCEGLHDPLMAKAFIEKGAKVYISWTENVLASHTDQATTYLLQHLVTEKKTIKEAVEKTMKEVGPDPIDKSVLLYYPLEAGEQTIENTTGNPKNP